MPLTSPSVNNHKLCINGLFEFIMKMFNICPCVVRKIEILRIETIKCVHGIMSWTLCHPSTISLTMGEKSQFWLFPLRERDILVWPWISVKMGHQVGCSLVRTLPHSLYQLFPGFVVDWHENSGDNEVYVFQIHLESYSCGIMYVWDVSTEIASHFLSVSSNYCLESRAFILLLYIM